MIEVHQAIYGDKDRGYGYLDSSFPNPEIPKQVSLSTDVGDRPQSGVLPYPIIRSFLKYGYYLVIKSFPQLGEGIRGGRVFSHVLFIREEDLDDLHDFGSLLDCLMPAIAFPEHLDAFQIEVGQRPAQPSSSLLGREAAAINMLLNTGSKGSGIVWVKEEGFWSFVKKVWANLPGILRKKIRTGYAFDPLKVDEKTITLLTIPDELESTWIRAGHQVIRDTDEALLEGEASGFLAGDKGALSRIGKVAENYGFEIREIGQLLLLEGQLHTIDNINSLDDLRRLIVLADMLSKWSPNSESGSKAKTDLLLRISFLIPSAPAGVILGLKNANWGGFDKAELQLAQALDIWGKNMLKKNLMDAKVTVLISEVFKREGEVVWWQKALQSAILERFTQWEKSHAKALWYWLVTDFEIIHLLEKLGKKSIVVEADMIAFLPSLKEELATTLLRIAKKIKWLRLHGLLLIQLFPPKKAFVKQLEFQEGSGNDLPLRDMAAGLSDKIFLEVCLKVGDNKLIRLGGEVLAKDRKLFENFKVDSQKWRELWQYANSLSADVWEGIGEPQAVLFRVFDLFLDEEPVAPQLLIQLSESKLNDLSTYERKDEIWVKLPTGAKSGFLQATLINLLRNSIDSPLDSALQSQLKEKKTFNQVAKDKTISVSRKLSLINQYALGEERLRAILETNRLDPIDSKQVGEMIMRKGWTNLSRFVHQNFKHRSDFINALSKCYHLLGFWERAGVHLGGYAESSISRAEWIEAFTELCCDLLPSGPSSNGVWESCGGRDAELLTNTTGKNQWKKALRHQSPRLISKLLERMKSDFPGNQKLKQLDKIRNK